MSQHVEQWDPFEISLDGPVRVAADATSDSPAATFGDLLKALPRVPVTFLVPDGGPAKGAAVPERARTGKRPRRAGFAISGNGCRVQGTLGARKGRRGVPAHALVPKLS